ncbi:MAG: hypothetical protein ACKPKO_38535, partial [Candidatus Fonsibacter sp.]
HGAMADNACGSFKRIVKLCNRSQWMNPAMAAPGAPSRDLLSLTVTLVRHALSHQDNNTLMRKQGALFCCRKLPRQST